MIRLHDELYRMCAGDNWVEMKTACLEKVKVSFPSSLCVSLALSDFQFIDGSSEEGFASRINHGNRRPMPRR